VSTTIDSSSFYHQVIPSCPHCKSDTTALGVSMQPVWELIKEDIYHDRTVAVFKTGNRCGNCDYEKIEELTMTTYTSPAHNRFEDLVENMRKWQKEYFKNKTDQALQESKKLEKEVDTYLKQRGQYDLW